MADNDSGGDVNINVNANTAGASSSVGSLAQQFAALQAQIQQLNIQTAGATSAFNATATAQVNAANAARVGTSALTGQATALNTVATAARNSHLNMSILARELVTIGREAAEGRTTYLAGSITILARALGLSNVAILGWAAAFAAVAIPIGVVMALMHQGEEELNNFTNSVKATGGFAGITASQFYEMGDQVAAATGKSSQSARQLMAQIIATGRVSGENIPKMAMDAQLLSKAFNEKPAEALKTLMGVVEGAGGTTKEFDDKVAHLNDQFHFLTLAEFKQIEALYKHGDAQGALGRIFDDFKKNLVDQQQNLGYIEQAWRGITDAINGAINAMMSWGRTPTNYDKLNTVNDHINYLKQQKASMPAGQGRGSFNSSMQAELDSLQQQRLAIIADEDKLKVAAAKTAKTSQSDTTAIDKYVHPDKPDKTKKAGGEVSPLEMDRTNLENQLVDQKAFGDKALQIEDDFWKNIASKTKAGTAEHEAAVKASKTAELEIYKRSIQMDLTVAEDGANLEKQQAQEATKAKLDVIDAEIQAKEDQVSETKKYDAKSISDLKSLYAQKLAATNQGVQAVLQAEIKGLEAQRIASEKLGDSVSVKKDLDAEIALRDAANAEIVANERKTAADIEKINKDAITQSIARYKTMATTIGDAFRTTIEGLVEKTTSWSQVWINLQRKAFDFVLKGLEQMVIAHLVANQQKVLSDKAAAVESGKISFDQTIGQIKNDAIAAFTAAYKATVGIPFVGPILAPIAGGAAFAAVAVMEGGAAMFSAAGGMGAVPYDNAPFLLHKNEMVLPANLANPLRNMLNTTTGSSSTTSNSHTMGDLHVHVYPARGDTGKSVVQSVKDAFRQGEFITAGA